jgi:mercuric reductase
VELAGCRDRRGSGIAGATLDYHHLPRTTYTSPAIADDDLTDAAAVAARDHPRGPGPTTGVCATPWSTDTRGVIKLIAERDTGQLLGAHVIAEAAEDVIATLTR